MALLREERNAAWWQAVADHPQVKPHVGLGMDVDLTQLVGLPLVVPLAATHGGFLLMPLDPMGRVFELHTMFRPEAWGTREIVLAAKEMFSGIFIGADVVVTHEVDGWKPSQPPRSFGFRAAGDYREAMGARLRTWILTKDAWEQSPARARSGQCRLLH